jgi:hypothetical protein
MAVRRGLVNDLRLFDVAMGPGSVTRSGEDTYALYRLLVSGYAVVYTPDALLWHRHRRDHQQMRMMLHGYGTGQFAFWTRCIAEHRDLQAVRAAGRWSLRHYPREILRSLRRRGDHLPVEMLLEEIRGALGGPRAYVRARRLEREAALAATMRRAIETGNGHADARA